MVANRAQFYRDFPSGPFFGFNRDGVTACKGMIANCWRQGMMGSAKAHYDGIKAFSETDFTENLKALTIPMLVMHGEMAKSYPSTTPPHYRLSCCRVAR